MSHIHHPGTAQARRPSPERPMSPGPFQRLRRWAASEAATWRAIGALVLVFVCLAIGVYAMSALKEWGDHRAAGDNRIVVYPHR